MERLNCIICNSDNNNYLKTLSDRYSGDSFKLVKCECGFIFLNPRPDSNQIQKYYKSDLYEPHSNSNNFFTTIYNFIRDLVFRYRFILLNRYSNDKTVSLLDIGAGKGDFARFCKNRACNVTIQDIIKFKSTNDVAYVDHLSSIEDGVKYNFISLWHSLEHIHNIDELFKNIKRLSTNNTTLFIAIPNRTSIDQIIYNKTWVGWDVPRHLYHFSYNDINNLLNKNGWCIHTTKILYQDTFYNSLLSLKGNRLRSIKFIFHSIFMLLMILINSNFCSSRLYICRKQ